jgi:acetyl coenzyme A synthetase (ADP forming)-like protein
VSRLAALETDVVLRDGSTLHLRPAHATDRPDLERLDRRLTAEGWRGDLSFVRLAGVPAGDGGLPLVLVGESGGAIGAIATCTPGALGPEHADVAFAMEHALQGRGIGTAMLDLLARVAWDRGVRVFHSEFRRDNDAVMRMFAGSGFEVAQRTDGSLCHVTISLEHTPRYTERAAERSETAATASVRSFLEPRSVAVVGASPTRGKIGAEVLQNLIADGFTGRVFAIHPTATRIGEVPAYPRVTAVPDELDLVVICVPAAGVAAVVDDCIEKRVKALLVITAGFAETGAAGRALEADLVARIRRAGMRMVGPNCMGLLNTDPAVRLNATFSPVSPPDGRIAMSTQSGALGLAILDYARELNIGLSTFVSIGNKADVSTNDLLQYWAHDPRTSVVLIYVESFGNPRKFSQIARRLARLKPVVAVKAGRSEAGARAANSHTGALASRDDIVDALFHQAGVIRTATLEELFDVATVLAHQPVPRGRRVAVVTNAGGPGILAADACEAHGLELPPLGDASVAALRAVLPPEASVANPIDMIASASAAQYEQALDIVLRDERVDSVLVIFIPPLVTKTEDVAHAVRRAVARHPGKTILGIFMSVRGAASLIAPIPSFRFPEDAAAALARTAAYGEWLATPEPEPPAGLGRPDLARATVAAAVARGGGWLTSAETAALLDAIAVPAAASAIVTSADDAVQAADRIGYPVVVKAIGPRLVHKTEVGGVVLDLMGADAVRRAFDDLRARLSDQMAGALVQPMIAGGVEMLVGAVEDETFGPVIACATGGTQAELLADSQIRLYPLDDRQAAEMIDGLRGAALLRGFRGAPVADEAALRRALLGVSALVGWCPELREFEINPLMILPQGVRAVDVRARVDKPGQPVPTRRVRY